MGALPRGTVAFLFTDIEGSTERWEQHRSEMIAAIARHDALLRGVVERNGGHVFKTVGDALYAAFDRVADAALAAIDGQRALGREDFSDVDGLRVRMALHVGEPSQSDGDYHGRTLNRIARLLAIGNGGQILVSATAADVLGDSLPEQLKLQELGEHRLKDLSSPERVFQLVSADLPHDFAPLRSLNAHPNNLPLQLTTVIGRDEVVASICKSMQAHRLVTLVGTGGIGKTRVALAVTGEVLERFRDGVWFVDLAPVRDPMLVAHAIAAVLHVSESPKADLVERLAQHLKACESLIVLDNCEHVLSAAAQLVEAILAECSGVRILTTTRETLRAAGEYVHRLKPLDLPPLSSQQRAQELQAFAGTALFLERANSAGAVLFPNETDAAKIVEICRHLDGLPLAIELVAARTPILSLEEIGRRLDERFALLSRGPRNVAPRQQTLRALIDWSYDLLSGAEQAVLRRLAYFEGGATLSAIEAVCADTLREGIDGLDLVSSLTDKSLVVPHPDSNVARFSMLESIREYARVRAAELGEGNVIAQAQARWVASFAAHWYERRATMSSTRRFAELIPELANVRSALHWAFDSSDDITVGAMISGSLGPFWFNAGLPEEGAYWIERALRHDQLEESLQARNWLGFSYLKSGQPVREAASRAIHLYEKLGSRVELAYSYGMLAFALTQLQLFEDADTAVRSALSIWQDLGKAESVEYASDLHTRAMILHAIGNLEAERQASQEVTRLFETLGEEEGAALVRLNRAELEFSSGNVHAALQLALASADTLSKLGDASRLSIALANSAGYYLALGKVDDAAKLVRKVLESGSTVRNSGLTVAIQHAATIVAIHGHAKEACLLAGYVDAWYRGAGLERQPTEQKTHEILARALGKSLSQESIQSGLATGGGLTEQQALSRALEALPRQPEPSK